MEIIRNLFKHVSDHLLGKSIPEFNVEAVNNYSGSEQVYIWGCVTKQGYQHITYEDSGVKINYHAGVKSRKGDTDWFVDQTVFVYGLLIYKSE